MRARTFLFAVAAAATLSACAATKAPEQPLEVVNPNASIPFANFGGVRSWQARDDGSLLLEGITGRWYRATFFSSCTDVRYAETIGIKSEPTGRIDKFSGVQVRDRFCPFKTLEEVVDPKSQAKAAPSAPVESGVVAAPK